MSSAATCDCDGVSIQDRSRYKEDGFDLDLSYITENCIAMSLPATGLEAKYRNPIEEVVRFFRVKHQPNKVPRYITFTLCSMCLVPDPPVPGA